MNGNATKSMVVKNFEADVSSKDRFVVNDIRNSRWYMKPVVVKKDILSEGSYGKVYKIMILGGDELVMKISKKSDRFMSSDYVREVAILRRIHEAGRDNDRIVKLVGANMDDGYRVFFKYYVYGDLVSFLRQSGRRLSTWHKRRMSTDILMMLQELRSHNIVHRDIKASNIAVSEGLRCILLDFGMAVEYNPVSHDLSGRFVRRVHCRAPEVAVGIYRYSYQADTFSVGCVLWELLTSGERFLRNVDYRRFRRYGGQAQSIFH